MSPLQNVVFVEHVSTNPNCEWKPFSSGKQLVALKDIVAGEAIAVSVDECVCTMQLAASDMHSRGKGCISKGCISVRPATGIVVVLGLIACLMYARGVAAPDDDLTATQAPNTYLVHTQATTAQQATPRPPIAQRATGDVSNTPQPRSQNQNVNAPSSPNTTDWVLMDDALAEFEASKPEIAQQIARFTEYVVQRGGGIPKEYLSTDCSYVEPVVSLFSTFTDFIAGGNVAGFVPPAQPTNSSLTEVPRRAADSVVWTFSTYLPQVVKKPPTSFADRFIGLNLSRPFGSWGVSFFNVSDIAQQGVGWYPQVEDPAPPLYALVTRNAYVANAHVLTCDGHLLFPGGFVSDTHGVDDGKLVTTTRQYDIVVPFCVIPCAQNYYHFVHEHLPRITLVHGILTAASPLSIRLVLPTEPNRYMRYYLIDVLGIPAERIIWDKVIGRQVVFPMSQRSGNTAMGLVSLMRDMVFSRVATAGNTTSSTRLLLVFSERENMSRMPRNYNELKAKLKEDYADRLRFETILKESAPKQLSAFRRADIVLGPHGANLANMIWMRKGAHLIEIMSHVGSHPIHLNGNMCYYNAASRVGIHHHLLLHPTGKRDFFTLSYDELRSHIDHALDELRGSTQGK